MALEELTAMVTHHANLRLEPVVTVGLLSSAHLASVVDGCREGHFLTTGTIKRSLRLSRGNKQYNNVVNFRLNLAHSDTAYCSRQRDRHWHPVT